MIKGIVHILSSLALGFTVAQGPEPKPVESEAPMAPEWVVSEWINSEPLALEDFKNQVVVLELFQLWCPGCKIFSIPLMKSWVEKFKDHEDIQFISIHSVFEGHSYQTPERLLQFVKEQEIHHPVGIDYQEPGRGLPETMGRYKARGTPSIVIIDKQGRMRFRRTGPFAVEKAERLIYDLLDN